MQVIACFNIKGGVGKTASAVNLAYLSAKEGKRTLLWDLDSQGAATFYLRVKTLIKGGSKKLVRGRQDLLEVIRETDFEHLDLLPAYFSNRKIDIALSQSKNPTKRIAALIRSFEEDYDRLFLDCAPGLTLVSENIFEAANAVLAPTIPSTLAMRTLEQLRSHLDKNGPAGLMVLPFFCMVDRRKKLHKECISKTEAHPFRFLDTAIPYASAVEQMGLKRAPVHEYAANNEAAQAYSALWAELMSKL